MEQPGVMYKKPPEDDEPREYPEFTYPARRRRQAIAPASIPRFQRSGEPHCTTISRRLDAHPGRRWMGKRMSRTQMRKRAGEWRRQIGVALLQLHLPHLPGDHSTHILAQGRGPFVRVVHFRPAYNS